MRCTGSSSVHSFRWSLYETIASSLRHRAACRLWPKPDGTLDAIGRAAEYSDGASWCDKRRQKSFWHRPAQRKLSVGADTAQRIWHSWLYSRHYRLRWKSWHAIAGERQLPRGIAIRCSLLPALQQIAQHFMT